MENKQDSIEINGKFILYIIVIAMILLLVLASLGIINLNFGKSIGNAASSLGNYANIPEKCRPTAGYNIESWKEHLGHHAETQECLKYFE